MNKKAVFTAHRKNGIGLIEYRAGESMKVPHYHDTYEIYLQTDGDRYITIENESRHLVRGDLVLIEPYVLHMTESRDSTYCRRYLMNLYMPLMKSILRDSKISGMTSKLHTFITHLGTADFDKVYHMLNNIYIYYCRNDALSNKLLCAAAFELMDFMCGLNVPPLDTGKAAADDAVSVALKHVHCSYASHISLNAISELVNMSKSNFCLVFRKSVGESFVSYLNHVRISHAHRMLCETDKPVKEIAEDVGFTSPSYMISVFKKLNGITPSEARRAHTLGSEMLRQQ